MSLIELMVAITLGLIVIGSLVTFVVSSVASYSANTRLTRLTQDLRASMGMVIRDVRRTGYDAASVTRALTSTKPSDFVTVVADEAKGCVTYIYDTGAASTRSRGFRINTATGALQMAVGAAVDCAATSGWEDVTDPAVVEIVAFVPALVREEFCGNLGDYVDPTGVTRKPYGIGQIRTLAVCIKGRLRADTSVERYVVDVARVRGDDASFNTLSTTGCPAIYNPTKDASPTWSKRTLPPTIAELNDLCEAAP